MRIYKTAQGRKMSFMIATLALLLIGPGCSGARPDNPIMKLRERLNQEKEYSVILADMKENKGLFSSSYEHRYQIIINENVETDDWKAVPPEVYRRYASFLGMTILSKTEDGTVSESASPPGYQYVGNPKYGHWETDRSGNSFWSFYGKYAMFSHLFGLGSRNIYRNDWNNYRSYSARGRPYYGPNREYGTNGSITKKTRPNFYRRNQLKQTRSREKFGNKVQRRVGRTKTGYRSRSGGFGK